MAKKLTKKKAPAARKKNWQKRSLVADVAVDRRKHQRRAVLDTFHMFLCLKEHGLGKFHLRDISENGFAFEIENPIEFSHNSIHECRFFINPGLSLPMTFRVAHLSPLAENGLGRIGAEIVKVDPEIKKIFMSFVKILDQIAQSTDLYNAVAL